MEKPLGIRRNKSKPKELQKSRVKHDEAVVSKCYNTLSKLSPIFNPSDSIVSLFSDLNATEGVQRDLLKESIGKTKAQEFIDNRIKQNNVGFYDTIKKNKLKTFSLLNVTQTISVKGKEVTFRADRSLFGRLLIIREKRGIGTKEVLQNS